MVGIPVTCFNGVVYYATTNPRVSIPATGYCIACIPGATIEGCKYLYRARDAPPMERAAIWGEAAGSLIGGYYAGLGIAKGFPLGTRLVGRVVVVESAGGVVGAGAALTEEGAIVAGTHAARGTVVVESAGGVKSFLLDKKHASQFAKEIVEINKKFSGGELLNSCPSSAIHTALYYESIVDQGASIFKSIVKDHIFLEGNKRTAIEVFKSFARKNRITIHLLDSELIDIAERVAIGHLEDISKISAALVRVKP